MCKFRFLLLRSEQFNVFMHFVEVCYWKPLLRTSMWEQIMCGLTCAGCTACPKRYLSHSKHFLYRQISNLPRNKPMPCSLLAAPQTQFPPPAHSTLKFLRSPAHLFACWHLLTYLEFIQLSKHIQVYRIEVFLISVKTCLGMGVD